MNRNSRETWARRAIPMIIALVSFASTAQSATILIDNPDDGANQIQFFQPSGQSFTALGNALTSIGFYIEPFNQFFNDPTFTMELRQGSGTDGTLLDSATVTLATNFEGFATITDFNDVALLAGSGYTAVLLNDTPQWGYRITNGDVYAGGTGFVKGIAERDLWFSASFASVPEPTSLALLGFGFACLGWNQRKRVD